jgi:Uma2 family endonuclease
MISIHTPEEIFIPPSEIESDEPELESDLHRDQIELLIKCLKAWWEDRNDFYATGNLTIYYNQDQLTTRDFRGPDFFVVLGAENRPRKSWVLWAENGKYPNVIVELLSPSTAKVDRTFKKKLYQDIFRTPEYFWFHPETLEFKGFRLNHGKYRAIKPNAQGWLWSEELELYLGVEQSTLRYFTPDGQLILTAEEQVELERQQREQLQQQVSAVAAEAELERQQREQLQQQVAELQAKLRALGQDPEADL